MRLLICLVIAIPALAGCLVDVAEPSMPRSTDIRYLDAAGMLSATPAESVSTPLEWSLTEWFEGVAPPSWRTAPFEEDRLIESVNVTIQYSAQQPLVHTETRPPFTIWFGIGDEMLGNSIVEHAFAAGPNPWDGSAQTITFDVDDLPLGGLTVLAGQQMLLHVGSYYTDGSETGLVNVDLAGSFVEFTHAPLDFPGGSYGDNQSFLAQLQGGRCVVGINPDDRAIARFNMDVPEDAGGLIVRAFNQGGVGAGPDIDFGIFDAEGTEIAHAAGPGGDEGIYLYGPNMDQVAPGQWTIEVYNCQPQVTDVIVQAQLFWPQD